MEILPLKAISYKTRVFQQMILHTAKYTDVGQKLHRAAIPIFGNRCGMMDLSLMLTCRQHIFNLTFCRSVGVLTPVIR